MSSVQWRDCEAWRNQGLPMTTTSNEACKLYDASLSQLTGYYELEQLGGFSASIDSMLEADPNFILGQCFKLGVSLLGSDHLMNSQKLVKAYPNVLQARSDQLTNPGINKREQLHIKAVQFLHRGALGSASDIYEELLLENPTDMMAIKFSQSCYFYLGESVRMRDSVARIIPAWKKHIPLYSYLFGMSAFGHVETNFLEKGRLSALTGLKLQPRDSWSTHAIAHYNEYSREYDSGIQHLLATESDWSTCTMLAPHIYWHMSLFHLELNQHNEAQKILDDQLLKSNSPLDLVNSASLLARLGIDACKATEYITNKWLKLKDIYLSRIEEHGYLYYDIYMALVLGVCGSTEEKDKYFRSFAAFIDREADVVDEQGNNVRGCLLKICKEIGTDILRGMCLFGEGDFDGVIEVMYPLRYDVVRMGGSNAQRDLVRLVLIWSGLQAKLEKNKRIGIVLLRESVVMGKTNILERIGDRMCLGDEWE